MLKGFSRRICAAAIVLAISCGAHAAKTRFDFDGDGKADILWRNSSTGQNYIYFMNGTAILKERFLRQVADLNWTIAGVGDFDGDGKADILWRNTSTGENYIYFMDGTTIKPTEGFIRTVPLAWTVAGIGDFDGDGKDDILWRNSVTGENYLYPMDGLAIKPAEGYLRTVADLSWQIVGVGDFDGDGKADILWRNSSTGQDYIYFMDGTTIKPTEGFIRTVTDQNWRVAGVGDFDGDGKADILWRNSGTGENYLYPMNGTTILGTEGYIRTVADLNWQTQAVGDYNGDGKADILWRNSATGDSYLSLSVTNPVLAPLPLLLWFAGMETGNLLEWSGQNVSGAAISIATLAIAEGIPPRTPWVMKQSLTGSSAGTRMYQYSIINSLYRTGNPIYYSFWAYFPQVTTLSQGGFFNLLQIQSIGPSGMDPVWILGFHPSNFTLRLEWWSLLQMSGPHVGETGGKAYDTSVPIPVGQWVFIQVMVTPREDFTGAVKVWQNAALIFDIANVRTKYPESIVPAGTQSFFISKDAYGQGIIPIPNNQYVDDVTISLGQMSYP
jgi:hypothetical protein